MSALYRGARVVLAWSDKSSEKKQIENIRELLIVALNSITEWKIFVAWKLSNIVLSKLQRIRTDYLIDLNRLVL